MSSPNTLTDTRQWAHRDVEGPLLDLDKVLRSKAPNLRLPSFVKSLLKRILHIDQMNAFYDTHKGIYDFDFARIYLRDGLGCDAAIEGAERIPSGEQPLLFVSNHPLGGLDGIILALLIGEKRDYRVRLIVNDMLLYIRPLAGIFVPVNKVGKQSREYAQLQLELWNSDLDVLTFPAGACSRLQDVPSACPYCGSHKKIISDLEWKHSFIRQAVKTKRDVVPIYFEGHNSQFFYRLAYWRKKLGIKTNIEMLFLVDEMYRSKGKHFRVHVGKPIPYTTFDNSRTPSEWAQWVKEQVYSLSK